MSNVPSSPVSWAPPAAIPVPATAHPRAAAYALAAGCISVLLGWSLVSLVAAPFAFIWANKAQQEALATTNRRDSWAKWAVALAIVGLVEAAALFAVAIITSAVGS